MIFRPLKLVLLAALLVFIYFLGLPLIPEIVPRPVAAASFTLYGRISPIGPTQGWGTTASTTKSPGPTLVVAPSESVTMSLFSADGIGHTFCVDYNGDGICDPTIFEPLSPTFSSMTVPVTYQFTATSTPGNYTYYCSIHGAPMIGTFRVQPTHDVAVTGITSSRTFGYSGVASNPVQVNITASNLGGSTEQFFVSLQANSTLIGNQTVTVLAGQTRVVTFSLSTSTLSRGNYALTAHATTVPGETNTSNNSFTGNTFTVKLRGDVNGDCKVDILDVGGVTGRLQKITGDPRYDPAADLNNDGVINILDVGIVTGYLGQKC